MSKFSKKLDKARLKFFGSKKIAGKKMKHDGSGNLDDEEDNSIPPGFKRVKLSSGSWAQSQQNILQNSYGSYLQNQSNWVVGGISGNCTCPLCVTNQASQAQANAFPIFAVNINWSNNWVTVTPGFTQPQTPNLPRDPNYNNDFGWRCWSWCTLEKKLYSPIQNVLWPQAENHAHKYDESSMVRGVAGIHARFVPENWEELECPDGIMINFKSLSPEVAYPTLSQLYGCNFQHRIEITGLVERFGKYVEGENGWRSEWAIIRKLYAPTTEIGLSLEQAFPEVEVIYPPKLEYNMNAKYTIGVDLAKEENSSATICFYPCTNCGGTGIGIGQVRTRTYNCYVCNGAGGTYKTI